MVRYFHLFCAFKTSQVKLFLKKIILLRSQRVITKTTDKSQTSHRRVTDDYRRVTDESQTTTDESQTTKDESQTNTVELQTIKDNTNYRGVFSTVNMV